MTRRPRISLFALHFTEYSYRLSLELSKYADIHLIVAKRKIDLEAPGAIPALLSAGCRVSYYDATSKRSKMGSSIEALIDLFRFRPDISFAHEYVHPIPFFMLLVARLASPIALLVHDPVPHAGADSVSARRTVVMRNIGRKLAYVHFVHGDYCARLLRDALPSGPEIVSIPHGPLSPPTNDQRRAPIAGRILFFGRLEKYKGLPTLFAAADILRSRLCNFSVEILGGGSEEPAVAQFARSRDYVIFNPGFAPAADVVRAMQEAAVIVLPYDEATQSGVLSMAFANSRPVVATAVGSLVEVVTPENGTLSPPGDPQRFADCLQSIISDELVWRRMSLGASKTADDDLSWARAASAILRHADRNSA